MKDASHKTLKIRTLTLSAAGRISKRKPLTYVVIALFVAVLGGCRAPNTPCTQDKIELMTSFSGVLNGVGSVTLHLKPDLSYEAIVSVPITGQTQAGKEKTVQFEMRGGATCSFGQVHMYLEPGNSGISSPIRGMRSVAMLAPNLISGQHGVYEVDLINAENQHATEVGYWSSIESSGANKLAPQLAERSE